LLEGSGPELDELAAALIELGHEVIRHSPDGAAGPDAIFIALGSDTELATPRANPEVPIAWVGSRARVAALSGLPAEPVIGLPLSRAEVATHATVLLAGNRLLSSHAEARRLREMFIAMVVHDLKNPLATVVGNAEYLSQAPELSHDSRDAVDDLLASAGVLGRVVMELVDVGRGLDGPLAPSVTNVLVAELLTEVVRAALPRASQNGVAIALDAELGTIRVPLDRDLIRRVVDTLIDNALKHAPRGTTITVGARARAETLRIEVHDDGRAIPVAEIAGMFHRATVFDHSTSGGVARSVRRLAMFFCLLACEAHGGRIWAESPPGGGANFCLELPRG